MSKKRKRVFKFKTPYDPSQVLMKFNIQMDLEGIIRYVTCCKQRFDDLSHIDPLGISRSIPIEESPHGQLLLHWVYVHKLPFDTALAMLVHLQPFSSQIQRRVDEIEAQMVTIAEQLRPAARFAILKRDAYRCQLCGAAASDDPDVTLEVDHILARSRGGSNDPSNLQTLCFRCNRGKHAHDF